MIIVHILPQNSTICGGIKVHYQLSEIETSLDLWSCIAFPDANDVPTWFDHKCAVMDYRAAKILFAETRDERKIVVGWEDPSVVKQFEGATHRVCYIQGEVFVNRREAYEGIHLWYSSKWNSSQVGKPGPIIPPFIDSKVFYPAGKSYSEEKWRVLVQERKAGREKWKQVLQYLAPQIQNRLDVVFLPDSDEKKFALALRNSHVFFAHSYPEGFGLPALEAMASGTVVVGYSGGGGRDFMVSGRNCFYSKDGDASSVAKSLTKLLFMQPYEIDVILDEAQGTAKEYSRERTRNALEGALHALL